MNGIDEKLARKIMKALRPDSGTDYHNPTKNEMIEINEQTTTKVKYLNVSRRPACSEEGITRAFENIKQTVTSVTEVFSQ